MKKYILTTALTVFTVAAAHAQSQQQYNYSYEYQAETPSYSYEVQQYNYQPQAQPYGYNQLHEAPMMEQPMATNHTQSHDRNWDFSIFTGIKRGPEYKGAGEDSNQIFIAPTAEYRFDEWQKVFFNFDNGLGYSYKMSKNLEVGAGIGYRYGRNANADAVLAGLDDIDDTATYHAFAKYNYYDYSFGIKFEKGIDSSNDGLTTEFTAGYAHKMTPKLLMGAELAAVYGDDTYMEQNFGVTAAEATAFRPQSNADAGFSEASLKLYANYELAGPHSVSGAVKYTQLLGDAEDSSVVDDDTELTFVLGYGYSF